MTDKPSASERQLDEMARIEAGGFHAGYEAALKEHKERPLSKLKLEMKYLREVEQIAGGTARELSDLRQANAALTKEIAELKAERESHFALEESVLRELKAERDELKLFVSSVELHESIAKAKAVLKERDELRSGIDAFKYAADQNSIAANAWKLQAENLRETLGMVDSVGMEHKYALIVKEALAAFQKFREGK